MGHPAPPLVALGLDCAPAPSTGPLPSGVDPSHALTVDVLDVGQGDAILIRSSEGKTAPVDAGPSKDIVLLLRDRGVASIDLVVVTHDHADHHGGMDDVIRAFRPRVFLAPASSHTSPAYLRLLALVRDSGMGTDFLTDAPGRSNSARSCRRSRRSRPRTSTRRTTTRSASGSATARLACC